MNELPYHCTCEVSEERKVRRYLETAIKEVRLCLAIMEEDYRPRGRFGDRTYEAVQVERDGGCFKVSFPPFTEVDWRKHRTFILLDRDGNPLYRYTRKKLGVTRLNSRDVLDWTIMLGTERRDENE